MVFINSITDSELRNTDQYYYDHLFVMFVRHPGDSNGVFFSFTLSQTHYDRDVK